MVGSILGHCLFAVLVVHSVSTTSSARLASARTRARR